MTPVLTLWVLYNSISSSWFPAVLPLNLLQMWRKSLQKYKANTGHKSGNACVMADTAACLEDLYEMTLCGKRVLEKKQP